MSHTTKNRSFWRRSSHPISWHSTAHMCVCIFVYNCRTHHVTEQFR